MAVLLAAVIAWNRDHIVAALFLRVPPSIYTTRALARPLFNASVRAPVHLGGAPGINHCDAAVPRFRLTGEAPSYGAPAFGPIVFAPPLKRSGQNSTVIIAHVGWLQLTLTDEAPGGVEGMGWAGGPCYHGEEVQYEPERCPYEGGNGGSAIWSELRAARGWSAIHWSGGNGYDVRALGLAILWGPTVDNRDGTYTVLIRAEDPGEYTLTVHRNAIRGCAHAECDIPPSLCPKAPFYHAGWQSCWGEAPGPCAVQVASASLRVFLRDPPAPPPSSQRSDLPPCQHRSIGVAPGRWVRADVAANAASQPRFFGPSADASTIVPFPYVWQFYDCTLRWMRASDVQACLVKNQVVTAGFSRERSNLYDIAVDLDEYFPLSKSHIAMRLGEQHTDGTWGLIHNLSYVSTYGAFERDQYSWNANGPVTGFEGWMATTNLSLGKDLSALGLCFADNNHRPTALVLAVESLWPAWSQFSGRWRGTADRVLDAALHWCPTSFLVHKTATAARISAGSLTWQRMYGASRAAEDAAAQRGLLTLDSFVISQPWVVNGSVFPDGLHLYTEAHSDGGVTPHGNFVGRTISQLMLRMICFD